MARRISAYSRLLRSLGIDEQSYERFTVWCLTEELVSELTRAVANNLDHRYQALWERPDGLKRFREIARQQTGRSWGPHDLELLYERVRLASEKHGRRPVKSGDLLRLLWISLTSARGATEGHQKLSFTSITSSPAPELGIRGVRSGSETRARA